MDTLSPVQQALLSILENHPEGIGELDLMHALMGKPDQPGDNLALFQRHFLLRHQLYLLRDELWRQQRAHLEIGPISLRLHPYHPGSQQLGQPDPLRSYYLDLGNLGNTSADDVEALIDSFWRRLSAAEDKQQALAVFDLEESADFDSIKQRYRQLSRQHHPDKGGDTTEFQRINQAMETLRRYYGKP